MISYWTPYRGIDTLTPYGNFQLTFQFFFYWTPYRGIETCCWILPAVHIHSIEPLIGGLRRFAYSFNVIFFIYWTPYWGIETRSVIVFFILPPSIEPLIGGLILSYHGAPPAFIIYWTPYRGIDTIFRVKTPCWQPIEPLIGGLRCHAVFEMRRIQRLLLNPL